MLFGSRAFSLALMLQLCGGEVGPKGYRTMLINIALEPVR